MIAVVDLVVQHGPHLGFPHSSAVSGSRHSHMRELRIQHSGRPYRVLYAFDPRRTAILLLGGDKTGNDRWYDIHVPIADGLYEQYLVEIEREGLNLMADRKKWSEMRKQATPETLERARKKTEMFQAVMELNELRQSRGLTQEELANRLGIRQANVSKMEQRPDMHISTLRAVIEALGGELVLMAQFPDRNIRINRFDSAA